MPVGEVEVDHVDGGDARLVQRYVVIVDRVAHPSVKDVGEPEPLGDAPDAIHDLGGELVGVPLHIDVQIPITDHIQQNAVFRRVILGQMTCEIAGTEKHIVTGREVTVVLAVHQQNVDAAGRRHSVQHVGQLQQHSRARGPIVRTGNGLPAILRLQRLVGDRPRVPVGQQQHGR